jgi:23S rRNA G2445 N2-methylase RlmL
MKLALLAAPGLGQLVVDELTLREVKLTNQEVRPFKNHDLILIEFEGSIAQVAKSRLVEDIFLPLGEGFPATTKEDLKRTIPKGLREKILAGLPQILKPRKKKRSTNYAVFVKQDRDYELYRKDLAAPLVNFLATNFQHWILREPADVELWYLISDGRGILGLRLTDITFRQRKYRTDERAGSLRPTIAAALVVLGRPGPIDYVVDPMCGSGTILIERALSGAAAEIHGNDIDSAAVELAKESAAAAKVKIPVTRLDAMSEGFLKLHRGKVTNLICNLPFGKQFNAGEDRGALYREALGAWKELLAPGGVMTLLTNDLNDLREAARNVGLKSTRLESWRVKGIRAAAVKVWV